MSLFDALDRHDADARAVYAWTELSLDMAFLAAYGLLFAILLLRQFGSRVPLYLVPLAAAFADALENITVAALAASYDGMPSPVAWMAATFTLLKSALLVTGARRSDCAGSGCSAASVFSRHPSSGKRRQRATTAQVPSSCLSHTPRIAT